MIEKPTPPQRKEVLFTNNYIIGDDESQYLAETSQELTEKFSPKRKAAEILAGSYKRLGKDFEGRAVRVENCGTCLGFSLSGGVPFVSDSERTPKPSPAHMGAGAVGGGCRKQGLKLVEANFCKDRLCPLCSWRRTMKIYTQVSQVMNSLGDDYRYLFLTLTVPNCQGSDLALTVDALENAWRQLAVKSSHTAISKRFNSVVCGWFKALEVTHNTELYKFRYVKDENGKKHKRWIFDDDGQRIPNPFYNTYHPHFHVIVAVKPSYFTRDYINHDEWLDMWRTATGDPSITQVDIRVCKDKSDIEDGEKGVKTLVSAVCEAAKYSVKGSDYLGKYDGSGALVKPFPHKIMDDAVFCLSGGLKNRRLAEFGGCMKKSAAALGLDDMEHGDLLRYDGSEIRADVAKMIYYYSWSAGAYKLTARQIRNPSVDVLVSAEDDEEEFDV